MRPDSILLTTDGMGGVWQYSCTLARAFQRGGVRCHIAVLGALPPADALGCAGDAEIIPTGLPLDWLAADARAIDEAAGTLVALARSRRVSTVHLHSAAYVSRDTALPQIAVVHSCLASWWATMRQGALPDDFAWRTTKLQDGLAAASAVLAPSAAFAAELRRLYSVDCVTVHNGIDEMPALPRERGDYVLCAGRAWDEAKGFALIDEAARDIGVPVLLAGELTGPHGAHFVPRHMRTLGVLDGAAMRERQAGAALFAAPSAYEPFGLAVLEAAACGTPLVLADIPVFRELWEGAAVFVAERDPSAWSEAMRTVLRLADQRRELGETARRRAGIFTARRMAERTLALHTAALSKTRRTLAA